MIDVLAGLVIDTFIVTGLNKSDLKTNFRHFFGIETCSAIVGFLLGQLILQYIDLNLFYLLIGIIIIVIQIIDIYGVEFPPVVTPLLIGIDSLFVFTVMPWFAILILLVFEAIAITAGSLIGNKLLEPVPPKIRDYLVNVVMFLIAIRLMVFH
ncbi:MAG: hypothetical protein MJ209_06805 [archaeon]|nr:hypothetical protein [archaeon]